jgi:histidinol dehydrogenase
MIRILEGTDQDLVGRRTVRLADAERAVAPIIDAVRKSGDAALLEFARKFDGFERGSFRIAPEVCDRAKNDCSSDFLESVETAACNIRDYAMKQIPAERLDDCGDGRKLGHIVRPLDSAGAYIPGGRYPLPSTLLMTVLPAQVAGVGRIAACCPRPSKEILGICSILGLEDVFQIGGAQAIAALAYGTETIPRVERIVGPGNIYVAAAKKLVAGDVMIDFIAGPTEIVIVAQDGNPEWLAADMLAQAEHDVEASSILLTTSRTLAEAVAVAIEIQLESLTTAAVAREAIERNSAIFVCKSPDEAANFVNLVAPEHVALHDLHLLPKIRNAGSVFIGPYSPEAAGDYASGPNHVLPTAGAARLRGGLSALDFVKVISVQQLTSDALAALTPTITTLARAEGLEAHARSVEIRGAGTWPAAGSQPAKKVSNA